MKIRKISQPLNVEGAVINSLEGNSTTNAPSIAAVKEALNGCVSQGGFKSDFNSLGIYGNGLFYVEATANAPTSGNYYLVEQQVAGAFIKQTARRLTDNSVYVRSYDGNQSKWCAWQNISNNYSTEEIIIGTWVNGKPLYRKVIPVVVENIVDDIVNNVRVNHNISNIEFGWVELATRDLSTGNTYSYGSSGYINAANNRIQWFLDSTQISTSTNRTVDMGTWYVSLCYTKTID